MVRTSFQDNHVPPWIPLQWVAKRRSMLNDDDNRRDAQLICQIDSEGGHYAESLQAVCLTLPLPLEHTGSFVLSFFVVY